MRVKLKSFEALGQERIELKRMKKENEGASKDEEGK